MSCTQQSDLCRRQRPMVWLLWLLLFSYDHLAHARGPSEPLMRIVKHQYEVWERLELEMLKLDHLWFSTCLKLLSAD